MFYFIAIIYIYIYIFDFTSTDLNKYIKGKFEFYIQYQMKAYISPISNYWPHTVKSIFLIDDGINIDLTPIKINLKSNGQILE